MQFPSLEQIIAYGTGFYFTKVLLWICVSIALFIVIKKQKRDRSYNTLLIYLILELALGLIDNFVSPNKYIQAKTKSYFTNFSNIIIANIEYYFFSTLHNRIFNNKYKNKSRLIIIFLLALSVAIILYTYFVDIKPILRLTYLLGSLEFLFVFYLSVVYFLNIIDEVPRFDLFKKGSFWCFLGALFYCSVSAPFYIVGPNFPSGNHTIDTLLPALLYYTPYSILFICISKGLVCKTPIWS